MKRSVLQLGLFAALSVTGHAEKASATSCPPMSFPMPQQNLAKNPGFEVCTTNQPVSCQGASCQNYPPSAATGLEDAHRQQQQ
jgi:hypothetical protein